MAQVFSEDRPLFANKPQVPQHKQFSDYAYKHDVQELIEQMLAAVFSEKPSDPLEFMLEWLFSEQKRLTGQEFTPPGGANNIPDRAGMQTYAFQPGVQELLQKLFADVFSERPEDPLTFMGKWLKAEKRRRQLAEENKESVRP